MSGSKWRATDLQLSWVFEVSSFWYEIKTLNYLLKFIILSNPDWPIKLKFVMAFQIVTTNLMNCNADVKVIVSTVPGKWKWINLRQANKSKMNSFSRSLSLHSSEMCVPPKFVCDGKIDCPYGDDEQLCYGFEESSKHRLVGQTCGVFFLSFFWYPFSIFFQRLLSGNWTIGGRMANQMLEKTRKTNPERSCGNLPTIGLHECNRYSSSTLRSRDRSGIEFKI